MIDIETVKFMKMLENLTKLSRNGIENFETATEDTLHSKIFYIKESASAPPPYRVVESALFDDYGCHDIIRYFGDENNYNVCVDFIQESEENGQENNSLFIVVSFPDRMEQISIENGDWYFI